MLFRSWRSLALVLLALSAFLSVASTARASHVSLTLSYDYTNAPLPGYRDHPFEVPFYADFSFDPGWSFYGVEVLAPVGRYYHGILNASVFPYLPTPPLPEPLFEVWILPVSGYDIFGGSVYLSGINDATGDIETVMAYYVVNVTGPYATPEPGSAVLLGLGAIGVAGRFVRRRS